jgi:ribosomal protein L13E
MAKVKTSDQELREFAIAKLVALGLTEAELRALGLTSDGNN